MSRPSLSRTGSAGYRLYLRSQAWGWRRQRWFRDRRRASFEPACQVCQITLAELGSLDLHHVSYDGVTENADGSWTAGEADADLMPLCRVDHRAVHRMMDRRREFYGWDRYRATVVIVAHLHRQHMMVPEQERARVRARMIEERKADR